MLVLAIAGAAVFAFVNTFGAWVTQYRRRWIAALFMLAAFLLVVAAVGLVYRVEFALWPLAGGLLLTVISSLFHARFVTAQVIWPNHLLRLGAALLLLLAARYALT